MTLGREQCLQQPLCLSVSLTLVKNACTALHTDYTALSTVATFTTCAHFVPLPTAPQIDADRE